MYYSPTELLRNRKDARYMRNLASAEVRINQPFIYDRDLDDVKDGKVVYPDQLRLDWDPIVVAVGSNVLDLTTDLSVQKVS